MSLKNIGGEPISLVFLFCALGFDDVDQLHHSLEQLGVHFDHPPQKNVWGYGPQLTDPNGYVLRVFDHRSVTK